MRIIRTNITDLEDIRQIVNNYKKHPPRYSAFDTETTGLHIIYDKPFLFQFGWYCEESDYMFTYTTDLERDEDLALSTIVTWNSLVLNSPVYAAHNTKFDLHMLTNLEFPYRGDNITDTMFYIRAAHDNLAERNGGVPLGLKAYCTKYIDEKARGLDNSLQNERSSIAKQYNQKLKDIMNKTEAPEGYKSWTLAAIKDIFDDSCFDPNQDLTIKQYAHYNYWLDSVPDCIKRNMRTHTVTKDDIPYNLLDRDLVTMYGHMDIELVLKILIKLTPVIETRDTMNLIDLENKLIKPLYRMERVGFKTNPTYIQNCYNVTRTYIRQLRNEIAPLRVGQHAKIKEYILENFGIQLSSTKNEALTLLKNQHKGGALEYFIDIIQELRTLEKWISTYIQRFLLDLKLGKDDRLYTSINQVGTVSGRVTSDFQQFPKSPINDREGNELFHPRKIVLAEGKSLIYLDYSQIELRLQALYTILVGEPDLQLCRAYMPYKCTHPIYGEFDYQNPLHIEHWNDEGWVQTEDNKPWVATDVHGATTKAAFDIDETHPDFKALRYMGKRVNFAKNYGAQRGCIKDMFPDEDEETITKIDEGYYKAFPGIKAYQAYCYNIANQMPYSINLCGIKYYNVNGHNLINMMIQGSGAHFLKEKIIEIDKYLLDNNCYSKFQMNIHDELSFIWDNRDDAKIFKDIKKIMETWEGCLVPIVADLEYTKTTWAGKEEICINDLSSV